MSGFIRRLLGLKPKCDCPIPGKFESNGGFIHHEVIGCTLSWSGRPAPMFRWKWLCGFCGRKGSSEGMLPEALWIKDYPLNEDGWPTKDGVKLPIWEYGT